jgi:nucleoside-diphosphate-sugar epimerase
MSQPSVLITGASGFVGGQLLARFRDLGWRVVGTGRRLLDLPGYIPHDLTQPLPDSFAGPIDVVIHAAARSSPWGRRAEFERHNVLATQHVLDYASRHGRPRLVFISSASVFYRPCHQLGITEQTPFPDKAINHYAATKRRAEERVSAYPGAWVILRPRAIFGPGDTVLFPRILRAAQAGRLPLLISPDGPVVGDLIYIDNLVDYTVQVASEAHIEGCFNLTNNEPVPILDFLSDVFQKLDIPLPRRRVSIRRAMFLAWLLEGFYGLCWPQREPPITRFGVHVFAYSKTFDVSRMLVTMGPPRVPQRVGVERFVAWVKGGGLSLQPTH